MGFYYPRLKDLREDCTETLKQQDIADLLGTTQQTYSLWERGGTGTSASSCYNPR